MAKPATRQQLIDYCFRKLGAPVLEINVDDDQVDDLVDDAIQLFNERHFDGVERMYLKYEITQGDIDRGIGADVPGESAINSKTGVGIVTTTTTSTNIPGYGTTTTTFYENSNFLQIPDSVVGVNKIFKFDTSSISGSMFSIKYQLFLNDLYYFNSVELLQYSMTKTRLEDIDFLLTPEAQVRFNKRQDRLYLDIDWGSQTKDTFIVIDCFRALDPEEYTQVYNDPFVKRYFVALMKKQWGMNLIKFRGTKLPGGIELNGREIYDDGVRELEELRSRMMMDYETPPLDFIGWWIMALNPHFLQGSRGEQRLIQSLVNEHLKIYGIDVTFIPRKFVNQSTIIEEVTASKFDDNFLIEAYVDNYDGGLKIVKNNKNVVMLRTFSKIKDLKNLHIYTHLHVKEDAHTLYGFYNKRERNTFLSLISISGVGPSTAIVILSSLSADELKLAILDSDVNKIKSVKGIGLKTAERIILELKDKINIDEIEDIKLSNNIGNTIRDEALSALSSLGISKNVVEHHIDSILEANKDINLEDLIKEILKRS